MTQPQDMQQLIAQAAEMQANLQKAQEEILATSLTGTAANGLVEVTMTGGAEVTDIKIDPQVVDADDVDTLQDLILGAFQDGHRQAGELAKEKMGPLSQQPHGWNVSVRRSFTRPHRRILAPAWDWAEKRPADCLPRSAHRTGRH